MKRYCRAVLVAGLLASPLAQAGVYKCLVDGAVTFLDKPCPEGAVGEELKIEPSHAPPPAAPASEPSTAEAAAEPGAKGDRIARNIELRKLKPKLRKLEDRKKDLEKEHKQRLAEIDRQQRTADGVQKKRLKNQREDAEREYNQDRERLEKEIAEMKKKINDLEKAPETQSQAQAEATPPAGRK